MWEVIRDLDNSRLDEPDKALFRFVKKVNGDCSAVKPEDIETLHECGFNDEAIYDAVTVCALFNFYNRWIDGSGVSDMSPEAYRQSGKRLATDGYLRERKP